MRLSFGVLYLSFISHLPFDIVYEMTNGDDGQQLVSDTSDHPEASASFARRAADGPSDSELVACVCQGDESAFELLFERHKMRVSAIAGRFFQEHVEDIVQECFTRAFFSLREFSDRGAGSLAAWLSKIAFNTCYDELRRRSKRKESVLSELSQSELLTLKALAADASAESVAVSRDLANKLLAQLRPEDRLVLVLLDSEGLSVSEIAELMAWSHAKVKVRAFRARAELRRLLQKFV
jgi:RNA polymerase sigma-70 factor (ECF subfamily)